MNSKLKTSVAACALLAIFGTGIANAQDATMPADDAAPAAASPAAPALPEVLQNDAFADVTSQPGRQGDLMVRGTVAETGKDFRGLVNTQGELVGIYTAEGSQLPQAVLDSILPETVRNHPLLAEISVLNAAGIRNQGVVVSGQDESGDKVRIGFGAEGELMHFDRGNDMGPHDDMGRGRKRDHGNRLHDDRGGIKHERMERKSPPIEVQEDAVRSAVEAAGYTDLGKMRPNGPGITVEAVNPQGEPVVVTVNPQGEVVGENAR